MLIEKPCIYAFQLSKQNTIHYIPFTFNLHLIYLTSHHITLHFITLHHITLHHITYLCSFWVLCVLFFLFVRFADDVVAASLDLCSFDETIFVSHDLKKIKHKRQSVYQSIERTVV